MTKIAAYIVILFFAGAVLFIFFSGVGNAGPPIVVDKQIGKYLVPYLQILMTRIL